jgi:4-amino-4-deoxy-L-arabinose transferase-like glycosyltransferase
MDSPRRLAALIAVLYVALAVAYGLADPPFEATDEIRHYRYIRYLSLQRALPPVSAESSKELQAHHPPLYYLLASLAAAPVPADAAVDEAPRLNPFWGFRYFEPSVDNKSQYLHTPQDRWPFASSAALIVFTGRWLSTAFGLGVVWMAYRLGQTLFPDRPGLALTAMAFAAFNPTLLHSASSVNNDAAAAFFGAWAIVEAVRIAERGAAGWGAARCGAALGLGLMSKASVAVLGPVVVAAFVISAVRGKDWWPALHGPGTPGREREVRAGRSLGWLVLALGIAAAISGWWFVRNHLNTGDFFGISDYRSAWVGEADRARLIREAISGLPYAWTTVWGRFGYGQVVLASWTYTAWAVLCLLALFGLARDRRWIRSPGMWVVLLALASALAGWGALMISIPATAHARHILYAYPAAAFLLALGWGGLFPDRWAPARMAPAGLGFGV